jgi:transcription elongation factor GreA
LYVKKHYNNIQIPKEMNEVKYFTKEGLEKLRDELEKLKSVERPAISHQIAEAREKGDLSENAEYDAAKNAQGMLELRISKLEEVLSNARVIDESQLDENKVSILTKVKLKNLKTKAEMSYTLVPENEADIKGGKISVNSPVAKGLLGKAVGDVVEIKVPAGVLSFEIMGISR